MNNGSLDSYTDTMRIAELPSENADMAERVGRIKALRRSLTDLERSVPQGSRPLSIVHTKLDEAVMWLGQELRRLDDLNPGAAPDPYPTSRDPKVTAVDPIAAEVK